jgi:hypothetical protein
VVGAEAAEGAGFLPHLGEVADKDHALGVADVGDEFDGAADKGAAIGSAALVGGLHGAEDGDEAGAELVEALRIGLGREAERAELRGEGFGARVVLCTDLTGTADQQQDECDAGEEVAPEFLHLESLP